MEAEQPSTKSSRLKYLLAIFAVMPPVGYLIGVSFYQGYLFSFGVSADAFPLAIQDVYIQGHIAVSLYMADIMNWLSTAIHFIFSFPGLIWGLALFGVFSICAYLFIRKDDWIERTSRLTYVQSGLSVLRKFSWRNNHVSKALGVSGLAAYTILFLVYALGAISLCWVLPSYFAVVKGKEYGNKEVEKYLSGGCVALSGSRFTDCKSLISANGSEVLSGLLVAQAGDYIAFFDQDGSHVMKFPDGGRIVNRLARADAK